MVPSEVRWDEGHEGSDTDERGGAAGSEQDPAHFAPGDSLALPLLARVVTAHGGHKEETWLPAFAIRLRWPQIHIGAHGP